MEMEAYHNGFCGRITKDQKRPYIIWVIVDHLNRSAHFLSIVNGISMEKLVKMYISDIICLHGVPVNIVSDRDPKFTSRFWSTYQRMMRTGLRLSIVFIHKQMSNLSEHVRLWRTCFEHMRSNLK